MTKKLTKDDLDTICFWKSASEMAVKSKKAFESLEGHEEIDRKIQAEFHRHWDPLDDDQKAFVLIEHKRLNDAYEKKEAKKKNKKK